MTSSPRLPWVLASVLMMTGLLGFVAPAGHAQQERLDPALVSNNNAWTAEERARVEQFVDQHIRGLLSAEDAQIATSRDALTNPFTTAGAADRFKGQFSQVIAAKIMPAVEGESLKSRINAMIVCTHLTHPDALTPIRKGLADPNPGVRYPAAKALSNLMAGGKLSATQQRDAMGTLESLIDKEDDPFVVQPLFQAMAGDIGRVLAALNRRVDWHIFRADQGYDPEGEALQSVFSQLFVDPQRDPQDVKELARAAARYMLLAAEQLDQNAVPKDGQRSHYDIIKRAASALEFAFNDVKSRERQPDDPAAAIIKRDTGSLVTIARAWIDVLRKEPFNFTDAQLTTTEAAAPAAQ